MGSGRGGTERRRKRQPRPLPLGDSEGREEVGGGRRWGREKVGHGRRFNIDGRSLKMGG